MATNGKRQAGVGMVEILVALLVLAIGVLGYAGLQLTALRGSEVAHARAQATMLARDALERMKVNPGSDYSTASWPDNSQDAGSAPKNRTTCIANACDSAGMMAWDVTQLAWQAANTLPAGQIQVTSCDALPGATSQCVVVSWDDQEPQSCINTGSVDTSSDSKCVVMEVAP